MFETSASNVESERSSLVNEEVVLFLFQLQLDSELQRALNYEAFQVAREVRSRREQVSCCWAFNTENLAVQSLT